MNNIDVEAVVDGCLIFITHMWDAFLNDESLTGIGRVEVNEAMADPMLRLCRDYANTTKHLRRRGDGERTALVVENRVDSVGNAVTIGFGPVDDLWADTVDGLELAEAGYAVWIAWMDHHGIAFSNPPMIQQAIQPDW